MSGTHSSTLAGELGLASAVVLPGSVENVDTWYQHAECLVLTSRTEAWALVLVEAMANGCPVVSFDCNYGPAEVIKEGRNGLLVEDGNIGGLAATVDSLVQDRDLRGAAVRKWSQDGPKVRRSDGCEGMAVVVPDLTEERVPILSHCEVSDEV